MAPHAWDARPLSLPAPWVGQGLTLGLILTLKRWRFFFALHTLFLTTTDQELMKVAGTL